MPFVSFTVSVIVLPLAASEPWNNTKRKKPPRQVRPVRTGPVSSEPEIIELLGKETTLKLERALEGQRKYIASNPSTESPIVAVIGMKAAQKLATRFGGMLLYIP